MEEDFGNILRLIVLGVIVLSWIGGQFFRVFLRNPQQKEMQRRAAGAPQRRPPAQQGGQQQPGDQRPAQKGGLGREIRDFLEYLQREAEKQQPRQQQHQQRPQPQPRPQQPPRPQPAPPRPAAAPGGRFHEEWEQLDWEPLERPPERPAPPIVRLPLDVPVAAASSTLEISADPLVSTHYLPPAHFDLPHWLNATDITGGTGIDEIRGMSPREAIILREIIGPPKAMQRLQGLGGRDRPAALPREGLVPPEEGPTAEGTTPEGSQAPTEDGPTPDAEK